LDTQKPKVIPTLSVTFTTNYYECSFDPYHNTVELCDKHSNGDPIGSLVHELCHADLEAIFEREGLKRHVYVEFRIGAVNRRWSIEHSMCPRKGDSRDACGQSRGASPITGIGEE
jgi:hypothetical protein